jgi:hypothetical protein
MLDAARTPRKRRDAPAEPKKTLAASPLSTSDDALTVVVEG